MREPPVVGHHNLVARRRELLRQLDTKGTFDFDADDPSAPEYFATRDHDSCGTVIRRSHVGARLLSDCWLVDSSRTDGSPTGGLIDGNLFARLPQVARD